MVETGPNGTKLLFRVIDCVYAILFQRTLKKPHNTGSVFLHLNQRKLRILPGEAGPALCDSDTSGCQRAGEKGPDVGWFLLCFSLASKNYS